MTTATTDLAGTTDPALYYGPGPVGLAAVAAVRSERRLRSRGAPYVDSYAYYDGPGYW
jgi:hypothetical protein